jgi:hypothetical protein
VNESRPHTDDAGAAGLGSAGRRRYLWVFVVVLALYALGLNAWWRYERDSCLYLGLARSLAETGTYSFNGYSHSFVWPGFPAVLAVVYAAIGENFLAMNLLMSLMGLGCIAFWYSLCPDLPVPKRPAFACFVLLAFSRTLYYYSSHLLADVPFTLAALVTLWLGVRMLREGPRQYAWCAAASAAIALACFLRPVGPCLLVALVAALWLRPGGLRRWKANLLQSALLPAPLVLAAGLWMLRCLRQTGTLGTFYVRQFITEYSPRVFALHWLRSLGRIVAHLADAIMGVDMGVAGGLVLLVPILVGLVVAWRRRERLLTLYGVIYLAGICVADPGRRYLLPALPVLLFWLVLGGSELLRAASGRLRAVPPRRAVLVGTILVSMLLASNLLRISKLVYQARQPSKTGFYKETEGRHLNDLFDLAAWLQQNARHGDLVLAREDRFLHYFSRVRTLSTITPRFARMGLRYGRVVRLARITLIVRDPEDPTVETMDAFLDSQSAALDPVARFGELRLLRLNRGELGQGGP